MGKGDHCDDINLDILMERAASHPSHYIDVKLSEEGLGGGSYLPATAR